jgi:hypothetical protein
MFQSCLCFHLQGLMWWVMWQSITLRHHSWHSHTGVLVSEWINREQWVNSGAYSSSPCCLMRGNHTLFPFEVKGDYHLLPSVKRLSSLSSMITIKTHPQYNPSDHTSPPGLPSLTEIINHRTVTWSTEYVLTKITRSWYICRTPMSHNHKCSSRCGSKS